MISYLAGVGLKAQSISKCILSLRMSGRRWGKDIQGGGGWGLTIMGDTSWIGKGGGNIGNAVNNKVQWV